MAISYEELTDKHPCYARGKKGTTGRIHLPISPTCNIECRFCDRRINDYEKRPGVTSTVIKPEEAIDVIPKPLTQERLEEILFEYGLFDSIKENNYHI